MQYTNPVLRGFNPDPSICRVGDDYYLAVSTFEYFPSVAVCHSRDLVNWELIGHVQTHGDSLDLRKARENGGAWAPTIREHEGVFYLTVSIETSANHFSNLVFHAAHPAGPWSAGACVDIGGIDPSLFFEDGKAYYCTNDRLGEDGEGICAGVIDPKTGETLEAFRRIWSGTGGGWLEAPHIYHIGDWYYLLCAEGGTSLGHMAVIARSKSVWGPYESCPHNPILTNRNDTTKQACCCGHGDLIEDADGNWWMVHLGVRPGVLPQSQLGRETFLTPLGWERGWPVIRDSRARICEEGPLHAPQKPWQTFRDEFKDSQWPHGWYFVRNPDLGRYTRGDGMLRICPASGKPDAASFEGLVCTRQPDLDFKMRAQVEAQSLAEGVSAGLMVMVNHLFWLFFGVRRTTKGPELFVEQKADDLEVTTVQESTAPGTVTLQIRGSMESYACAVLEADGSERELCRVSARFLSNSVTGRGFTGAMTGLYACADGDGAEAAVFRHFVLTRPDAE